MHNRNGTMRVAHLINNVMFVGGLETYVLNLIPELRAAGIEQAVVYRNRDEAVALDAEFIPFSDDAVPEAVAALERFGPSLVHVHNIHNLAFLEQLLDRFRMVFTTHTHNLICPANDFYLERPKEICERTCSWRCLPITLQKKCMSIRPQSGLASYRLARWAIGNRDRIAHLVCPCTDAGRRHRQAGFSADRVSVIPYFCELPPLAQPRALPDRPTILFLGRIRDYKGYEYFLEMLAQLPEAVQGVMVGDFTERTREAVGALAQSLGVADRLDCRPWVERGAIRDLFEETTVCVFPSILPETLGIVGLEALATGVPVVAFDVGGVTEWLIPGETGYLAAPKDTEAAARALGELLFDEDALARMGRNGLDLIREKFSRQRHLDHLLRVYHASERTPVLAG
ncbi:MAG: glycosyltransferase family 4 protein [Rhodothermales bacterium]|nr:glycosyltransferase family 4 protein [Rhodothermales bacterium]